VQAAIAIGLEVDRRDLIQFRMAKTCVAERHCHQAERSAEFGVEAAFQSGCGRVFMLF
jgi:hypothetical protein